jgi:hypothetical protein
LELAALAEAMKGCDDAARCAEALDKATNAVRKAAVIGGRAMTYAINQDEAQGAPLRLCRL